MDKPVRLTLLVLLLRCTCLDGTGRAAEALPTLWVDLSDSNSGSGLAVPSAGDGVNRPVQAAGRPARQTDPGNSSFLYVRITHPAYTAAPRDVYVSVDIYDDAFRWVGLHYDKADAHPSLQSRYTQSPQTVLLIGSGTWQRHDFSLPQVRMAHSQNNGADFRLTGSGLTIGRIEVRADPPPGYTPGRGVALTTLQRLRVHRRPQLELTFGNDAGPQDAALLAALGVTSIESYVDWAGVEPDQGTWDWRKWDAQVDILEQASLKWVPFLLAGMPYATPLWFQNSKRSVYYRCLEHGEDNRTQTLFNPHLPARVDSYLAAFAERYRDRGVIESILLGVTGIYGESIYPAGPDGGGWTARLNGPYHNHEGWWAGDAMAVRAFQAAMHAKYDIVDALNRAWSKRHASFDTIVPFLPDAAPNDRARADMAQWYQQAMTDWTVLWVQTARRHFPQTEIYLCTGGRGTPELGADFTAQAKAIAPYGAGIRITNEGSDYAGNFTLTREVATATRFYETFAGFEPAGEVDADGVVARLYNAAASGARQLHFYHPNVLTEKAALDNYRANVHHLVPLKPIVPVALYVSRESWEVDAGVHAAMYAHARVLRDLTDFDMITRTSVADGILERYKALMLLESPVLEPTAAKRIEEWVKAGGLLLVTGNGSRTVGSRLYPLDAWRKRLLAPPGRPLDLRYELAADAPDTFRVLPGTGQGDAWLHGDWHGRERGPEWASVADARKRWTGSHAGVRLPTRPGADYTLRIDALVSGHSLGQQSNRVQINGEQVGRLDREGVHCYEFHVPQKRVGTSTVTELAIDATVWRPADYGSEDPRRLGVAIHKIEWIRAGASLTPPTAVELRPVVSDDQLATLCKRSGLGMTVNLAAQGPPEHTWSVGAYVLNTTRAGNASPVLSVDGRIDGRYSTLTDQGVLWYDGTATIRMAAAARE